MTAVSQKWTLKIEFAGEVRRLRDWPQNEVEPTFQALRLAIVGLFEWDASQQERLNITYQDDGDDTCSLQETNFLDFLTLATKRGLLRLVVTCSNSLPESTEKVESTQDVEHATHHEEDMRETEEPTSPSSTSARSSFQEVHHDLGDRLSETRRLVRERLQNARPHVGEGFAIFKQQVIEDFQLSSTDMKDAFGPQESHGQGLGLLRGAMGTVAGALAAARLAPIRATRLTAHSVAAVAGKDVSGISDKAQADAHIDDDTAVSEFEHLKQQVKKDFHSTRNDVNTAFNCLLSGEEAAINEPGIEQDTSQSQPPPVRNLKTTIPRAVSTVVGASAAACLLPLRGARFAVANITSVSVTRA